MKKREEKIVRPDHQECVELAVDSSTQHKSVCPVRAKAIWEFTTPGITVTHKWHESFMWTGCINLLYKQIG